MAAHLRIASIQDETDELYDSARPNVTIRLGDLLPLVALAEKMRFIWLQDFLEDEVVITDDLYDVLQAFRSLRPAG